MAKGIVYLMTSAVEGLIKIGKTETKNFKERMRHLEKNGYYNVIGLKCYFAMELEDYSDKEKLLQEIFSKHQLADSELFALDVDLVQQLLLSFEGKIIYPKTQNKEKEFKKTIKRRRNFFSFYKAGIKDGSILTFCGDTSIKVKVVSDRKVEYKGDIKSLSTLAAELYAKKNIIRKSGTYRGAHHFMYKGKRLV